LADYAGIEKPDFIQGKSFRENLQGDTSPNWRSQMYYRYWLHSPERPAHFGLRNKRYKLIFFYGQDLDKKGTSKVTTTPSWEFYDLQNDPKELYNAIHDKKYKNIIEEMKTEIINERIKYLDLDENSEIMKGILPQYFNY